MRMGALRPADDPRRRRENETPATQTKLMEDTAEGGGQRNMGRTTADMNLQYHAESCDMTGRGGILEMIAMSMLGDATTAVTIMYDMKRQVAPRGPQRQAAKTPSGARSVAGKLCCRRCVALGSANIGKMRTRELPLETDIREIVNAFRLAMMTHVGIDSIASIGTGARTRLKSMDEVA